MSVLTDMNPVEIGRRLRIARDAADIRQEEAAAIIGLSRATLVAIEKGERLVRVQELQALAFRYGVTVNALLRDQAVHVDLVPRFRRIRDVEDPSVSEAVKLMHDLVQAEVELEDLLGIVNAKNYPPEKSISKGDVVRLAEQHVAELRSTLGLGNSPIADIFSLIEFDLGIRLYQRPLASNSKISGLFAFDQQLGACILLNANHPWERRVQTAAHELGHFIGTRHEPEVLEENERFLSRSERYANAFGREFTMPKADVQHRFKQLIGTSNRLSRRHVILLAYQLGVSRQAAVMRLEELGLVKTGTWDWFENNGKITIEHAREVLGELAERHDPTRLDAQKPVSQRMASLAYQAWKQELVSETQLSDMLKVTLIEVREMLDQFEIEERDQDEFLRLPR